MINTFDFIRSIKKAGIDFVTGVPDSLLKDICAHSTDFFESKNHIIATNEGSAIGLAIGHYLATSKIALVYMQNSGLGNTLNPILSLADRNVYSIPMMLLIGWRAEMSKDKKNQLYDEPQHISQGRLTLDLLKLLKIPFKVIDSKTKNIEKIIPELINKSYKILCPVAIVVRKSTFAEYQSNLNIKPLFKMSRESAIETIVDLIPKNYPVVATTGMTSRELFEIRKNKKQSNSQDFLTIGGMGHSNHIALGLAISLPKKKIVCIDGDGSLLMHMGTLALTSEQNNFVHILINNAAHDSVGGQPTKGNRLDFCNIAKSFGYKNSFSSSNKSELKNILTHLKDLTGSIFVEVKCRKGFRDDLGRPDVSTYSNKNNFMKFLK